MRRRIVCALLCMVMVVALIGCGSSESSSDAESGSGTEEETTLTKTEYIKLAKETGYRAAINLTYLTQFSSNEIIYADYADTMSDAIADSAFATMEEYYGLTESAITFQSSDVSTAYGSYLRNVPDDEEAQGWYDVVAPLCEADMSLYSATCANLDKYESSTEFTNTISDLTDNLNDLINEFYHFETDHPVSGTDFFAGYYFSYPEDWWTKNSDDGTYYYIYPEEDTHNGMVMLYYHDLDYGDPLTNIAMDALSIENSDSTLEVESNTGTLVCGVDAAEVIYTQLTNGVEYNMDTYIIANGNKGALTVSLVVPKDSNADYSDGFDEVIDSLVYTGLD